MRVAAIDECGRLSPHEQAIPSIPEGGALLRVKGCGICGSDLDKVVKHKSASGSVLGHEVVGILEALSPTASIPWALGTRVVVSHHVPCGNCHFCRQDSESMCLEFKRSNFIPGGFSEVLALSAGHLKHTAFPVPDTVSDEEASCTEPLACVLRAYRRTRGFPLSRQASSGQSVLVVGLGFIGLLAAQAYGYAGEVVYGAEVDQARLDWAISQETLKAGFIPERQASVRPQEISQPVDTVFLTVVNEATLRLAFASVRDGGQILLFASPGTQGPGVMLNPDVLYFRELTVLTSYSPALQDLRLASELIFSHELSMRATVSETVPLEEITLAMERYRTGQTRKVFVQMSVEADSSENHVDG